MQSLLQVLNIGTLATWLSVTGASTVAVLVPYGEKTAPVQERELDISMGEVIDLDAVSGQVAAGSAAPGEMTDSSEVPPFEPVTPVEEVAPLPELAEVAPLPDVPDVDLKADDLESSQPKPKATPSRKMTAAATGQTRPAKTKGTPGATGVGNGLGNGSAAGSGSGSSGEGLSRVSRGNIPKPNYPEECRRKNQEGRVSVTFTFDETGNVVSAKATGKSPFTALDQAAVDTLYRAKFPPGTGRFTFTKAIVFKLN
jgi:protein TonB